MKNNPHTWTRLTRLYLQHLSISLGNAALNELENWPKTGEGRDVKARTENITRTLEYTLDRRDINYAFDIIDNVINEFEIIRNNSFFIQHLKDKPYTDRKGKTAGFDDCIADISRASKYYVISNRPTRVPEPEINHQTHEYVQNTNKLDEQNDLVGKLSDLTPSQQFAPLQFEFIDGILKISPQKAKFKSEDRKIINDAKISLFDSGNDLVKSLIETNCDQRLISYIQSMCSEIKGDAGIVRLGLTNITCQHLFDGFCNELPDVANAKFRGFSVGMSLFVGQFPEWHKFLKNASQSVEFSNSDVSSIERSSKDLIQYLLNAPDLIDPEVPRSIQLLLELLRNPNISRSRAIFAVVRSLENLLSKIFSEASKLVGSILGGANDGVKLGVKTAVASSLLLVAAQAANGISPVAEKISQSTWLKQAANLINDALK